MWLKNMFCTEIFHLASWFVNFSIILLMQNETANQPLLSEFQCRKYIRWLNMHTNFTLFFQGSTMGDVGAAVCCGGCALCQTAVEVQERGDHQWCVKLQMNFWTNFCKRMLFHEISFYLTNNKYYSSRTTFDYCHFCKKC